MSAPATESTETILERSAQAFAITAASTPEQRAAWLGSIADALDAHADELIPIAQRETNLPAARLSGELLRTSFQARLFRDRLLEGALTATQIDPADPNWPMGPRPDIRLTSVPIGPVLVFAAGNFPFAFSVAGGDTVSAIAAGCPVVVKVHPGHPELSRAVAAAITAELHRTDAPADLLTLIEGDEQGVAAVRDSRIKAVGFTGSTRGGRFLFDLAVGRPDPIPFYGELGATNPVVVTPRAWQTRADDIASGFAGSFTMGAGQFCTKPGVLLVPDVDDFVAKLDVPAVHPMLNARIRSGYESAVTEVAGHAGVRRTVLREATASTPAIEIMTTTVAAVLDDPGLLEIEMFGPAALIVGYADFDEVAAVLALYAGSLTGTVQAGEGDDPQARAALAILAGHVGRVVWNQWPTGVTVSDAQNHGGPWPSSTAPLSTSVGTAAIGRFLRPVAYQNVPDDALPAELR